MAFIQTQRVLEKLDAHFGRNEYDAAEQLLLYWLSEARTHGDDRSCLLFLNELAGLYRKLAKEEQALQTVESLLRLTEKADFAENIGTATSFINCATVCNAFGRTEKALPLFEKAKTIYEKKLPADDPRNGGLYNNMALALADLARYDEAYALFDKALSVVQRSRKTELEVAVTFLNIGSVKLRQLGPVEAAECIQAYAQKGMEILDAHEPKDGQYAFVCSKCASAYAEFGFFAYEKELEKRAREIYERS